MLWTQMPARSMSPSTTIEAAVSSKMTAGGSRPRSSSRAEDSGSRTILRSRSQQQRSTAARVCSSLPWQLFP
ncbi:hypothetical protein VTN02DRAFT_1535 [Thermoascus thermophilus]